MGSVGAARLSAFPAFPGKLQLPFQDHGDSSVTSPLGGPGVSEQVSWPRGSCSLDLTISQGITSGDLGSSVLASPCPVPGH